MHILAHNIPLFSYLCTQMQVPLRGLKREAGEKPELCPQLCYPERLRMHCHWGQPREGRGREKSEDLPASS